MNHACLAYNKVKQLDAVSEAELAATCGECTAVAADGLQPRSKRTPADYSEEAIPERDPAYRMLDGTIYEAQTVDALPADVRLALARYLQQLGMSAARAAMVASL